MSQSVADAEGDAAELIGRDALLRSTMDALRGRTTSGVLLRGPSGVGKTRLAREVSDRLRAAGRSVHLVRGSTALQGVPMGALAPLLAAGDAGAPTAGPVAQIAAVHRAVVALGGGRPLVLVADEVGLLDSLSLTVLAGVVEQGSGVLLGTIRDDQPVPDPLVALWTSGAAVRIDVPPLDAAGSQALIEARLGGAVAARAAEVLHRSSGGNPLMLRELVAGTLREGHLTQVHGVWRLTGPVAPSPALVELIEARLAALPDEQVEVMQRLAVCGQLALDELPGDHARAAVRALEREGLVIADRRSDGGVDLRLAHPQYETTLRATTPSLVAEDLLLEELQVVAGRPERPADTLRHALWRLEATGTGEPGLLLRAARLARVAHDFGAVLRLSRAAIRSVEPSSPLIVEATVLLAEAERELGRPDTAASLLTEIRPIAGPLTARVRALQMAIRADRLPQQAELEALLAEAAPGDVQPEGTPPMTTLGMLVRAGRFGEAVMLSRNGAPIAGPGDAHASELENAKTLELIASVRFDDAVETARRALHLAVQDGIDRLVTLSEWHLATALLHAGRPRTAARWARDVASGAAAQGLTNHRALGSAAEAFAAGLVGDAGGARRALEGMPAEGDPDDPWRLLAEAWLHGLTASAAEAREVLFAGAVRWRLRGSPALSCTLLHALTWWGGAARGVDLLQDDADALPLPLIKLRARHGQAVARGDVDALVDVTESWLSGGARMDAAEAAGAAARAAQKHSPQRVVTALTLRAQQLAADCEGLRPRTAIAASVIPLTTREGEVAGLAAEGLRSQEIADRLFLSVRTVNNHLQATYLKLGISTRRELAAALAA